MTVDEIIAEIDEKYPNSLSSDSKVRKIDKLQKRIFRTSVKRTVVTTFDILALVWLYPIPFSPAKIREVLVNGVRYENRQLEAEATSAFYYDLDGGIGIYPVPTADGTLTIIHYQEPASVSSTSDTPDLDDDYHDLLVYGVCKEIAENYSDFDKSNGFAIQFNAMLDEFMEANQDTEPAQIQPEGRWWA